jgi:predicted AlkP superfamily pyrophosphatase or phosphodiesterase
MRSSIAVLLCLLSLPAFAKPPKLTLFVTVDALSADTFWRMKPRFKAGFATLANQGAYFPTVRYEYAETVTAAGHSTLVTGVNPSRHGVVSNKVLNRATNKLEHIFADASHPLLEAPLDNSDVSPMALMSEGLGDRVKLITQGKGKVISLASKARAAIALGGRLGTAFWFNEQVGRFITGTYYLKELPPWLKAFNDKKPADAYQSKDWPLLNPPKEYVGVDDRPFESDWYGMGRTFPHPLNGGLQAPGLQSYQALNSSPFANDLLVAAAKAAIDGEQLGKDDVPDLLLVSFSGFDRVQHLYGPYSFELQDTALRLDKALGDLIAAAEKAAGGRANLDVIVAADHGCGGIPEEWAAMGLDGVRVMAADIKAGLKKELSDRFKGADLVADIEETDVYLDLKAIEAKKLDPVAVRRAAAAWLAKQPDIAFAVARDDVETAPGPLAAAVRAGYYPDRSGDVNFVMKQYRVLEDETNGTSHGAPYTYDNEVPLFLLGKNVKSGFYPEKIRALDIAPTVSSLLEMGNPAMSEGSARAEALLPNPR